MQINRPVALLLSLVISPLVTACSVERAAPVRPTPQPIASPAPKPAPPPLPARPVDWRDAALTPGEWTYQREGTGTAAVFTGPQGARLLTFACHRERSSISMVRAGAAPGPVPATIVTTFSARPFSLSPVPTDNQTLILSLQARDSVLDEIAFSRGRFALEVNGLPTLYLPVQAEIGRVIEDCR